MSTTGLNAAGAEAGALLAAQLDEIERRAECGEWTSAAALLERLPQLVMRVPPTERRPVLLAAQTRIEALRERVQDQTQLLKGQLGKLKAGQRGAASYEAMDAMGTQSS